MHLCRCNAKTGYRKVGLVIPHFCYRLLARNGFHLHLSFFFCYWAKDFDSEGNPNYDSATAMLVTFLLNNHLDDADNQMAMAWEQAFLDIVQNFTSNFISISHSAEVGVLLVTIDK